VAAGWLQMKYLEPVERPVNSFDDADDVIGGDCAGLAAF
jgi:hypothetical protein